MSVAGLPEGMTVIGHTTDGPDPAVRMDAVTIPEEHRLHAMVLGSSGSGKSTILKMMIRQNLIRGEGVAVLDPHHDLAAWTAQRIPRWRSNHLVYVSPAQLVRTHKAVPINPLAAYGRAPGTAAASFTSTLMKAFDTKGVRMEQLLTQAATSLIASGRGGLGLLRQMIIDKSVRDTVLADVHIRDNLEFWENVFPNIAKEAVPAVDNKLTPIISNPAVGPFFEGGTGFDMGKLLDGSGILIFDGAGCDNDTERMIFTTFLLNMITTAAAKLVQSKPQGTLPKKFYLYVDEVQMLESDKLKEMLQQVRKWGIRITLAAQQLEGIEAGNATAMVGNCDLYIVGRCTPATARMVAPRMGADPDELAKIPKFHVKYHMGLPGDDIHGSMIRTRNMDGGSVSRDTLEEMVDCSLANYGVAVDMARYTNEPERDYGVTPLEMAILSALYRRPEGLGVEEAYIAAERFGAGKRRVAQALNHLVHRRLVDAFSGKTSTVYRLRRVAIDGYFDTAALKGRAGGDLHINTISALLDHYARLGYYTRMDTGDTTGSKPDLEVCEPAVGPDGSPDPDRWGSRVAIEVETGPSRHPNKPGEPGQVYKNWNKSRRDMPVWFLVYNERDALTITKQLSELDVKPSEYETTVISADEVLEGSAVPVPPGFVPAGPLPVGDDGGGAGPPDPEPPPRPEIERTILDLVPPDGLREADLRGAVPSIYGDREVADAVDRLISEGHLRLEKKWKWNVLFRE